MYAMRPYRSRPVTTSNDVVVQARVIESFSLIAILGPRGRNVPQSQKLTLATLAPAIGFHARHTNVEAPAIATMGSLDFAYEAGSFEPSFSQFPLSGRNAASFPAHYDSMLPVIM
jgi:hypothetical protein